MCMFGNARLSGFWIMIANHIPFLSSLTFNKSFEDKIFKVKQKTLAFLIIEVLGMFWLYGM